MSVAKRIEARVSKTPTGVPFAASDFAELGSRPAISQTLKRLADQGRIARVRRGLYVRPRSSRYVPRVLPGPREVVEELARRRNETVQIGGAETARRLGLSTQMPMVPTYWTSGRTRTLSLGNLEIRLRHASARKLVLAGRPAGDALAALYYLGELGVTPEILARIKEVLPAEEYAALVEKLPFMPAWMAAVFRASEPAAVLLASPRNLR